MITVKCPNCEATYQLDESKLANGGRKLKCAQCQTVWIARAEAPEVSDVPAEAAVPDVERVPATADVEVDVPAPAEEAFAGDPLPSEEELVQRMPTVDAVVHVGGWRQYVRGGNLWRSGALMLIAVGVLAGGGVLWLRMGAGKTVVMPEGQHEATEHVAKVSPTVVQPPKGVVLHHVRGEISELEGEHAGVSLTVRGLLTNTTSATLVVPPLRLELLGDDGKVADMWPVSNVSGSLAPAAEQAWTVSLTAPDMSSVKGWRVVFVAE